MTDDPDVNLTEPAAPQPPPFTPDQAAHLAAYERAPAAPEAFAHLITCLGAEFCRCPAAYWQASP